MPKDPKMSRQNNTGMDKDKLVSLIEKAQSLILNKEADKAIKI